MVIQFVSDDTVVKQGKVATMKYFEKLFIQDYCRVFKFLRFLPVQVGSKLNMHNTLFIMKKNGQYVMK